VLDDQTCDICRARHNKPFNDTFEAQCQRFREACLKVMSEISKALKRDMDKFHKAMRKANHNGISKKNKERYDACQRTQDKEDSSSVRRL